MADRVPVLFPGILNTTRAKLVADAVFTDIKYVVLTLTDNPEQLTAKPVADRFCSIYLEPRFKADLGLSAGGGRAALTFVGNLKVSLFARIPADIFDSDEAAMIGGISGGLTHYAVFAAILSSLEQYDPVDGFAKGILSEPMRCVSWYAEPRKGAEAFGRLVAEYQIVYQQALP